ncbi:MAG: tetratricopeptide repeat protein [Bacteroidetes bacterium]|nr:tetratricopeptide repeat protein [Crocinitomicaceae bacterium]MCB0846240.1 tetratricopeptide repeat protein [Bacteroidota bacterium]
MKTLFLLTLTFFCLKLHAQTIEELYNQEKFSELISYADKTDSLENEDLYCIGYAFFQLEKDKEAILMYDKAIEKGLDEDYIYLFKGLAQRYDKQFDEAEKSFREAIKRNPLAQKNYTELANCFYAQDQYDTALVYFKRARELDFELGDPYLKIPNIYQIQEKYEEALSEYNISLGMIDQSDPYYYEILMGIGQLEYTFTENYKASAEAYAKVVSDVPEYYPIYTKLIKSYYAAEEYGKGDSLFYILRSAYEKEELPEEMMESGMIGMSQFEWNDRPVLVMRMLKEPSKLLDIKYKVYLLNETGDDIDRMLMTEKTIQLEKDGAKHLLCERGKNGAHYTYSYGWSSDEIEYESLKKASIMVFEKELTPSASSNFSIPKNTEEKKEDTSKKKKKKKKKRNK